MAALGWLMNLNFAGSSTTSPRIWFVDSHIAQVEAHDETVARAAVQDSHVAKVEALDGVDQ